MDHFAIATASCTARTCRWRRIAEAVGTPVYVYSAATFRRHARVFRDGLAGVAARASRLCDQGQPQPRGAAPARDEGYGADVVSGGELARALAAGMPAADIVFSGVGKTPAELARGLDAGIGQFNLELEEEGEVLAASPLR